MTNPYIEHVRTKALDVLSVIFEGDMIEVWAAYIAIFPRGEDVVDRDALPDVKSYRVNYINN